LTKRLKTNLCPASIFLGLLLYPILLPTSLLAYTISRKKHSHLDPAVKSEIFWDRVKLNLSPLTLFCKHHFWIFEKESQLTEVTEFLKKMTLPIDEQFE
jgi:hypothetical protein